MITYKDSFIFLALVNLSLSTSLWGFSFELNKKTIQIGESAILTITLPKLGQKQKPLILDELLFRHPDLKILERNSSESDRNLTFTFEITAYRAQPYRIPPIQIKWEADSFSTEALDLTVTTNRSVDDEEIRPEFGKLQAPIPWRKAYLGIMAFLGLALTFWILRWSLLRIPWRLLRTRSIKIRVPNLETDRMWLRKELNRLKIDFNKTPNDPQWVDQILYTVKVYLKRRTQTPAPALTSKELSAAIPPKLSTALKSLLASGDNFKYQMTSKNEASHVSEALLTEIEKELL